jgi:hypothetical protein
LPGLELRQSYTEKQKQDMRELHQQKFPQQSTQEQKASDRLATETNAGGSSVHDIEDDRTLDNEILADLAAELAEQTDRDMASKIPETVEERTEMSFAARKGQQLLSNDGNGFQGTRRE